MVKLWCVWINSQDCPLAPSRLRFNQYVVLLAKVPRIPLDIWHQRARTQTHAHSVLTLSVSMLTHLHCVPQKVQVGIEHGLLTVDLPLRVVTFHSYISLPKGTILYFQHVLILEGTQKIFTSPPWAPGEPKSEQPHLPQFWAQTPKPSPWLDWTMTNPQRCSRSRCP